MAKALVVGVDDDLRIRESIESLTESAGYAPVVFSSAEEFLRSGMLAGAGCVIADVRLPGMDGIELQRRIRLDRPWLPVVFVSAHNGGGVRKQALDGGAIDFLSKPFDGDHLLGAIGRALKEAEEKNG